MQPLNEDTLYLVANRGEFHVCHLNHVFQVVNPRDRVVDHGLEGLPNHDSNNYGHHRQNDHRLESKDSTDHITVQTILP